MKNGARPIKTKHTDFDFIKSHKLGAISSTQEFPDEYFADAGFTVPNQDVMDAEYNPPVPPLPYGCTDYTTSGLADDLTRKIHNPNDIEAVTHANANNGAQIRDSMDAGIKLGWFKQYFALKASGSLDYFDTFRLAQIMGIDVKENRSISWGTPWFPSWERAAQQGISIMPMPTHAELQSLAIFPWHNSKLDGWSNRLVVAPGVEMYRDKSWQGRAIGDGGFLYFPREVVNKVMSIQYTGAFVPSNNPVQPVTIDVSTLEWIVSVLRRILMKYVPQIGQYL